MARYIIPNYRLEELQSKIQKIARKGANITFDVINDSVEVPYNDGRSFITCSEVEVSGEYKINGWVFVGVIQHASPENIIRLADYSFEGRIPERYRTAGRECEHCHIRRDRNDTYLVYNEQNNEFKQVGRTCLQSYTNGLNAETCASLLSVINEITRINSDTEDRNFGDVSNLRSYLHYPMEEAKKKAYLYVLNNGYVSGETGYAFRNEFFRNSDMPEATNQDIQNVETWLRNSSSSDWQRNALATWTKPYFEGRDSGLITSAVSLYLKARDREEQRELERRNRAEAEGARDNDYAGEIGDKVTFKIAQVRVLFYRQGGSYYSSSEYPVYRILGEDGKVYLWGCSSGEDLNIGDTLRGTIKRLNEYRGEKQTEVTRCKIIQRGENNISSNNPDSNAQQENTEIRNDWNSIFNLI